MKIKPFTNFRGCQPEIILPVMIFNYFRRMDHHGAFIKDKVNLLCGSIEKAEEMQLMYHEGDFHQVEQVKEGWIRKRLAKE